MDWRPDLTLVKDPDATLDYVFDWDDEDSSWLNGDTINSFGVVVDSGLTVESTNQSGGQIRAYISGGVIGEVYSVTCSVTTAGGRIEDRTIKLRIDSR